MNRYLLTLIFVLWASFARAIPPGFVEILGGGGNTAPSCAAGTNVGSLYSESFSGANTLSCGGTVALSGWTCVEEVGNTLDPDSDATALGCGFDNQSLMVERSSGSTNNEARIVRSLSSPGEVFVRFYIRVESHSIASSGLVSVVTNSDITHGVKLYNNGGNLSLSMSVQGTNRGSTTISTGVTYRVEYNIDDTNNLWGWKIYSYSGSTPTEIVNTTEQALTITTVINNWNVGVYANEIVKYYLNNVDISTTGWIGE